MFFSEAAKQQIDKLYQGRSHVELTIGILKDNQKEVVHFTPNRKKPGCADLPRRFYL